MSVRWFPDYKDIQKINGLECTKATKWHVTSRPDDLYEAVSGGWGPIETLRGLLEELWEATSDVDPAHIFTIQQKLDKVCDDHNAKKELLFTARKLPESYRECIVSEWVSLERWTWAAPELCFYRKLKNKFDDTWLVTLWAVPFESRPTSRRDRDTGSKRSKRPDAGTSFMGGAERLAEIGTQLSKPGYSQSEASRLISEVQTLAATMAQQLLEDGRTDSTSIVSAAPSDCSTTGPAPTNL